MRKELENRLSEIENRILAGKAHVLMDGDPRIEQLMNEGRPGTVIIIDDIPRV